MGNCNEAAIFGGSCGSSHLRLKGLRWDRMGRGGGYQSAAYSGAREEHMVSASPDFDAVVIGAGFSGMYMLKALRDRLGLKVRVYEAGGTVGGTWYWNRYPGARCDSEAYVCCFTWDKELLQEWEWSERYPEQPEILRYLDHVATRHDLKRDICFNTRVTGAQFDEASGRWNVRTDAGDAVGARFLITAVGTLSDTNLPPFEGLERFRGKWY